MNYKIEFLPIACDDLREIEKYLSQFYSGTPDRFFQSLHKKLTLLKNSPYIYKVWEDDPSLRRIVIGNYLAFYSISEERQTVTIIRIIDGRGRIDTTDFSRGY